MKKRIISATIMIAVLIPFVLIGGIPLRIIVGLIGILGFKEILEIKGLDKYPKPIVGIGLLVLMSLIFSNRDIIFGALGLDYKYLVFASLAYFIPTLFYYGKGEYTSHDALYLLGFTLFFGIFLNLLSNIIIYEKNYFWYLMIVTIMTDTFALITGKLVGKHKVTKISPNKTVEGCIGGAIMGTILPTIYYVCVIHSAPTALVVLFTFLLSTVCQLGDLFFSLIKREVGIKDFSNLIPGHGGVLDRIDSLSFVTMLFILVKSFI